MNPIRLVLHTHWDREWYLPFERFLDKLVPTIDLVLDTMKNDDRFTHFHLDGQIVLINDYLERRPERADELRALVSAGRLSCGPWMSLVDEFLVSGESIVRSLDDGLRAGDALGGATRVGYLPDQFGHVGQMPQILSNAGLRWAVTWRGVPALVQRSGFRWESPDGSHVNVVYMPFGYAQGARTQRSAGAFVDRLRLEQERSAPWLDDETQPLALMTGDDHEEPNPGLPDLIEHARAEGLDVAIASLDEVVAHRAAEETPVVKGELRSAARANLLPNTYSVRPYQKVERAGAEAALERYAEPLAALVPGFEWPDERLSRAWYFLHLNGAHDSVCGCSTDEVARAVDERTRAARALADDIADAALASLADQVDGDGELFFNPSPFERNGVPGMGWSVRTASGPAAEPVVPRVEAGWATFGHGEGAVRLRLVDQADHGDLYTFEPAGPQRAALELNVDGDAARFVFGGFVATVRATHTGGEDFLRLTFEVDNEAPDHRVQVVFAAQGQATSTRAGSAFEIVERPVIGEGGTSEPPPRQWPARGFAVAESTCVLSDGVFEYEVAPEGLGVTLLRCTGTISRTSLAARAITAGPDVPTPDAQMLGRTVRHLGAATQEPSDPTRLAEEFCLPLLRVSARPGGSLPPTGTLLDIDAPALSAVFRRADEVIVRLWNPFARSVLATLNGAEVELGPHRIETLEVRPDSAR